MNAGDTIAAISSAVSPAVRVIVRASGPQVPEIARALTPSPSNQGEGRGEGSARRCHLVFADLQVPAWVYLFIAPRSYTGEDLIEFHIPGNPILAKMLLQELIRMGARQADPGEFTARAYFNGRIDLAEAEGVAAVIGTQGDRELAAARQLMAGELARRLGPTMDQLAETLALLEAGIDFSEEDISFLSQLQLTQRIEQADGALHSLLNESARFERLAHEPRIVLVGRPNAGKSTLLNSLCGHERAIVSPQAGTTRDAIWAAVQLKRGTVRMIDVAGLDDSAQDEISRQMQERARQTMEQADFVVLVRDGQDGRPTLELERIDLRVNTKADLKPQISDDGLAVSAMMGQNIDLLRDRLDTLAFGSENTAAEALALNSRHIQAIQDARDALARVKQAESRPEVIAMELREALDSLGRVLGSVTPDDVLGRIFATFCVGK